MSLPLLTSAPGKVIIFGEHSAVFNEPAIAASVASLRTYLFVTKAEDSDVIELDFPDISLDHKWHSAELSSISMAAMADSDKHSKELNAELNAALEPLLKPLHGSLQYHAAYCFLYLYFSLCGLRTGVKFTVKSSSPIGAGLGSSASIAVCLALATGKLGGHLNSAPERLTKQELDFVNKWSFIGEKCIHGTPSGIDNAVATYGNAVLFQRQANGETKSEQILDFPQVPMILTNTRIPRSTKVLVSGVKDLIVRQPEIAHPILKTMGQVASRGAKILANLNETNYADLCELIRINHGLLVALGVSHPGLEVIKALADSMSIGSTKLTGAGGGGCALTILNSNASPEDIAKFKDTLETKHSYKTYVTGLGGPGCAYMAKGQIQNHLDLIRPLFETNASVSELNDVLLPGKGPLQWIH
ncbi:LANO_0H16776g1_1 [Lachancea nothofagi CBS 11611]|uniref:Mevalonate kinase n=1 Tax=Lachancea nothofagi CBS 11611 TaxID=1266666 RepID=A0A1G4KN38_9SACH|nr:LANO_0H16776g1_1 [Lachancea nothofagi CBS 11611]